ncbi:unnamed protein product [Brassica napus]|uniref:(rape) hypothetical protein n=1 Tax=Brassica napus TaxID=3708 RepID=A0A816QZA4_BRANA|nr:unnamed protein product [Brassica napus]
MELQARKQREAALESALADKEFIEGEYRKKAEEAKRREEALENDLANMWIDREESKQHGSERERQVSNAPRQPEVVVVAKIEETPKEEPLVARLKARTQEMKEKEMKSQANGDANSHICKVCFESPTAAILLPCRHFCCKSELHPHEAFGSLSLLKRCSIFFCTVCKSCSLACSECPICRTKISDRLFAFPS